MLLSSETSPAVHLKHWAYSDFSWQTFPNLPPHDAVTGTSQLLSLLHLSMLSLHHFRTPYLPFTRRTSGQCLGTFSRIFAYASLHWIRCLSLLYPHSLFSHLFMHSFIQITKLWLILYRSLLWNMQMSCQSHSLSPTPRQYGLHLLNLPEHSGLRNDCRP
jgi:hypothetical protein